MDIITRSIIVECSISRQQLQLISYQILWGHNFQLMMTGILERKYVVPPSDEMRYAVA